MSDTTEFTGGMPALPAAPGTLGGRYTPRSLLGVGGFGAVYLAIDRITGEEVAVKLVVGLDAAARKRMRRELAALRWLQMPGVVHLRDDGPIDSGWFIVMDVVAGEPFPAGRTTWPALRETARGLFETLARVHSAGVLHRDLKPSNVLVQADGEAVLLDFGVARGESVSRPLRVAGDLTRGWAAPELLAGEPSDARGDLWSAGRMLSEALGSAAPPGVAALLRTLTASDPYDRPRDADAVLLALDALDAPGELAGGRDAPPAAEAHRPTDPLSLPALDHAGLAALFVGPELFQHLPTDAAAVLYARTGGEPRAVARELEVWRRAGLARRMGDRWSVDRVALDRLVDAESAVSESWRRFRAGAPAHELVPIVRAEAARHLAAGRLSSAQAALGLGLAAVRAEGPEGAHPSGARGPSARDSSTGDQAALLADWVTTALAHESAVALDRALYELDRAEGPVDRSLLALARGGRSAYGGETDRALVDLDAATGLTGELECWRQGLRMRALARRGIEAEGAALEALSSWAEGDPEREERLDAWRGNFEYRRGAYAEAARLHLRCAGRRERPDRRVSARLNAANALLEALDLERCEELAARVVDEARALRHAVYEGGAIWVARAAAYRLGRAGRACPELVDAAVPLRLLLVAQYALNEAAIAWAGGEACAGDLALRGRAAFESIGQHEAARLCGALALAVGGSDGPAPLAPDGAAGLAPVGAAPLAPNGAADEIAALARSTSAGVCRISRSRRSGSSPLRGTGARVGAPGRASWRPPAP